MIVDNQNTMKTYKILFISGGKPIFFTEQILLKVSEAQAL